MLVRKIRALPRRHIGSINRRSGHIFHVGSRHPGDKPRTALKGHIAPQPVHPSDRSGNKCVPRTTATRQRILSRSPQNGPRPGSPRYRRPLGLVWGHTLFDRPRHADGALLEEDEALERLTKPIRLIGAPELRPCARTRHHCSPRLGFDHLRLVQASRCVVHRSPSLWLRNDGARPARNCRSRCQARPLQARKPRAYSMATLLVISPKVLACMQSTCICELMNSPCSASRVCGSLARTSFCA